jgi:pimeloyl-ACP methyl ester carboxylesterase
MKLAFEDSGQGPVVVLLHGFPLDRTMWAAQASALKSSYRVILPDLRGHGATAAPEGMAVYTMEEMAEDVVELLDQLGIREPVVLGGLSMGGYVALAAVARYPDRFRALLLIDTRAAADTPEAAKNRETLARQVEETSSTTAVVEAMLPRLFSASTRQQRPEALAQVRAVMERTSPRAISASLRGMAARTDRTAELPSLRFPSLVLVGAEDVVTPPDEARAIANSIRDSRLSVIPGAGHLAPIENAEACNEALLDFLGNLGRKESARPEQ